jgi:hypothetical protein
MPEIPEPDPQLPSFEAEDGSITTLQARLGGPESNTYVAYTTPAPEPETEPEAG